MNWLSRVICMVLIGGFVVMTAQEKKQLTIDDIYSSEKFKGRTVANIQWLPNGSAFTFTKANAESGLRDVYRHDVKSGKEMLILEAGSLTYKNEPVEMSEYHTTGNQNHLLITGPQKQIWRHSYSAPYYLYDIDEKKLIALANNDPGLQNVQLAPDGKSVAYAKENDLYVADVETGVSKRLTTDGSFNILNGVFDWVYEEEFGRPDAFRWSPDGKKIAFWRTDQTRVKSFILLDELPYYAVATELKYPKVGEQNAIVKIGVVDIASGETNWIDLGENEDIYIPRIEWTNTKNVLSLQRMNRKQNHLELLLADVTSGKTRTILEDKNEAWVDVTDDFVFLRKKDRFVWTSEKSGYRHIYLNDYDGKELKQLTKGDWEVSSVIGVDEKDGWVYFYGKKDSPIQLHLYRVKLDGKKLSRVSAKGGWHTANFAPNFKHYVGFSSDAKTPTTVTLRRSDGRSVRVLEDNKITALAEYNMVYPEFMTITTSDGVELNAYMSKPANFDPSKKYPVLVFGYGGPGSQMVVDRWGSGSAFRHFQRVLWHQMMTEKGYIIFCVDNRGTGGRGKAFKNLAYGDLSKWSVADQIEGAKYLQGLPYVEKDRIGFWGWSGGGYLACMIQTRAHEYFKTSVAVALVSDFRNYDTIWTERYMGLLSENKAGYDAADVLSTAGQLEGNLLLIHGSGDDNVHPQNTMQLVDKFIAENRQFDLMIYPNRNHRISGGNTSGHLFTLITNYLLENL